MASRIQLRRGIKSKLPVLALGELGWCTDTNELYIETSEGNVLLTGTTIPNKIKELESSLNDKLDCLFLSNNYVGIDEVTRDLTVVYDLIMGKKKLLSTSTEEMNITGYVNVVGEPHARICWTYKGKFSDNTFFKQNDQKWSCLKSITDYTNIFTDPRNSAKVLSAELTIIYDIDALVCGVEELYRPSCRWHEITDIAFSDGECTYTSVIEFLLPVSKIKNL